MSETAMLTLSEFLKERLHEEEDAAKGRYTTNPDAPPHSVMTGPGDDWVTVSRIDSQFGSSMPWSEYRDAYLIPAEPNQRVLEDIMSKRAIVDLHRQHPFESGICDTCPDLYPCATLRLLAVPYRRHPDFREEWA